MPKSLILRPFQEELASTVMARIAAGEKFTVVYAGAGSGKTIGYLHAINTAFREGLLTGAVILVPRLGLRRQAENDYREYRQRCEPPVMGEIIERENIWPLTPADKFGYATTYQSVVSDGNKDPEHQLHLDWARNHPGEFMLVLDEAQFLGLGDETGGTKGAESITKIFRYALHTIILTGTPTRSDGRQIFGATYSAPDADGFKHLTYHVRTDYTDGVALGYLRPCIFELNPGEGTFSNREEWKLSELERHLATVLIYPDVWKPIVDQTIHHFNERRKLSDRYRCMIVAVNQQHAREIYQYLTREHRQYKSVLIISDEGTAGEAMEAFRPRGKGQGADVGDIAVSVNMLYIGYDCPSLSVVGMLSATRWEGWMEQLVMRAGRMWDARPIEEQTMICVAPSDPAMQTFAERFRTASKAGVLERAKREPSQGTDLPPSHPLYVAQAQMTNDRIYMGTNEDQDLTHTQWAALTELQAKLSTRIEPTVLAEIFRKAGQEIPQIETVEETRERTYAENRRDWGQKAQEKLRHLIKLRCNVTVASDAVQFRRLIASIQADLNRRQRVPDAMHLTDDKWLDRLRLLDQWIFDASK